MDSFDVVVIGAGMAGLTCARALLERGLTVCVLEAQGRVGGRILTRYVDDAVVELGAEFVHGRPPELWALIEEAGLTTYEREGAQVRSLGDGALTDDPGEDRFALLEGLEDYAGPDVGFLEYVNGLDAEEDERAAAVGYVEGFNAADARDASVVALGVQQKAEDAIDGERIWCVREGYGRVPEYLAERVRDLDGEVRLETPVEEVQWVAGSAEVICGNGQTVQARRVVVAIPLGALQAGGVRFTPEPGEHLRQAAALRMGQVCRFTLIFRDRFWAGLEPKEATEAMSFLFAFEETPSVWWTQHPEDSAVLTGWVGGPRSDELAGLDAEALGERGCGALARVFGLEEQMVRGMLEGCHVHDWRTDAWTRGAYSYVPAGQIDGPRALGELVEDTLYFAGEHTDVTGHWGTVHAAMRSGMRAAEQILADGSGGR